MKALRWTLYALFALLLPLLVGGLRMRAHLERTAPALVAASQGPDLAPPPHDPEKKTVAVVVAEDVSEITDVLGPYEMFALAETYNVYAVAPTRGSVGLTGGLRMRPHYSLAELDALLDGRSPDVVVAPNLPNLRAPENRPVIDWVRRSAERGATSLSWCAGAAVLAEAGLLDGRTATTHWGDISRLEKEYPRVKWAREARWIDHGTVLTSAGITSGIDATLRFFIRTEGEQLARRVASEMRYPNFHHAVQPYAEQYLPRIADAVLFLNAAFRPRRDRIGLALYDGVDEFDLSAVYDAHAAAGTANVLGVSAAPGLVVTRHGLALEPALVGNDADAMGAFDRLIVPGRDARAASNAVASVHGALKREPEYLQAEAEDRFGLEPVLEDLARTTDVATATFAVRRLEYRSSTVRLAGSTFPFEDALAAAGLAIAGMFLVAMSRRVLSSVLAIGRRIRAARLPRAVRPRLR